MARLLLLPAVALATARGTDAVSETQGVATEEALQLVAQQVATRAAVLYDHVYVEHLGLSDNGKAFVEALALAQSLITECTRLLHAKLSDDGNVISGYYGASANLI
jgi:hypothetical protein